MIYNMGRKRRVSRRRMAFLLLLLKTINPLKQQRRTITKSLHLVNWKVFFSPKITTKS